MPSVRWKLRARETRLLLYLLLVLAVAAWKFIPRPWHPTLTLNSFHYTIFSTATRSQTESTVQTLELLYTAYSNRLGSVSGFQRTHPRLHVKLYQDRAEMRRVNPGLGWAEAFYRKPFCHAYYSAEETNPYHWMLHECVHQLNEEVAHLRLAKWLDEGLSEYFSASRLISNRLAVGQVDLHTYPVWWLDELATRPDLAENLRNGSVIPLRAIITDHGGPGINQHFNLYYLHWWTLTHFIWESDKYRNHALALVSSGGNLDTFERLIGPVDQVQSEWHDYVRRLKSAASGKDLQFLKTGKMSEPARTNATNPSAGNP